jgi:hypothetical protein
MGLDTSHNCWHGSYSSFTRWRHALAEAAGYPVWKVETDKGYFQPCIILDWGHLPPGHLLGDWPAVPPDPLLILLTHQDCEGKIEAQHCPHLANAIEALIPKLDDTPKAWASDAELARRFVTGLRKAHKAGEDVDFH